MTIEEAIRYLKQVGSMYGLHHWIRGACMCAIKALEKQIPKNVKASYWCMPIFDEGGAYVDGVLMSRFYCPCCGAEIASGELEFDDMTDVNYCDSCGQKLKWEEEEEQ